MHRLILSLDRLTNPTKWVSVQRAVKYYVTDRVIRDLGDAFLIVRGGISQRTGRRSEIKTCSIIMIDAADHHEHMTGAPPLTNQRLFERDRFLCAYCGRNFEEHSFTRDHIVPLSRGGMDVWMNCVACCYRCNQRKGNRAPCEAGMQLLYTPYVPDQNEGLLLSNRCILVDQMAFLQARLPARSRLRESRDTKDIGSAIKARSQLR